MRVPNLTFVYDRKGQGSKTKSAVIELRISQSKERKYISTGVFIYPKEWSNGSVVGRKDWKELNEQLQIIKKRCSEIIIGMMDDGNLDLSAVPRLLKDSMVQQKTFLEYAGEVTERRMERMSDGTKRHYDVFFKFLKSWKGIVYFSDITEKNVQKLDDKLREMGLKEVSRWNYHKKLKMFIDKAVDEGLVKRNPYKQLDIRKGGEDGLKRCLTPEEFQNLMDCKITIPHLGKVRDLFVFQTYTMMGYSDLAAFDYEKCTKLKGQMVYKSRRKKTGQAFTIVLLKPALAILEKYDNKLPIISNERYNEYLKAVALSAGIDKPLSTHWARHTGATILLNAGVPMHIIQHMLGHSSIRETERTYARLMDDTIVEEMVGYEKRK